MADVQLAVMRIGDTEERVALKRIRSDYTSDPNHRRQFEREARLSSYLRHENIVAVRAFGADRKGPFLALEYVDGPPASRLMKEIARTGQPCPLPVALSIARDAATALLYAHSFVDKERGVESGIIHRDISPDNLLIDSGGRARLSDFGVAKALGSTNLTQTGTAKGKLGYIAPELFEGEAVTLAVDVFALGATLYRIFCGARPFEGRVEAEVLRAVLQSTPVKPSTLRPDLPPAVEQWIIGALAKTPAQRPPLEQLLAALSPLLPSPAEAHAAVAACVRSHQRALPMPGTDPRSLIPLHTVPLASPPALARRRSKRWPWVAAAVVVGAGAVASWKLLVPRPVSPPAVTAPPTAIVTAAPVVIAPATVDPPVAPVAPVESVKKPDPDPAKKPVAKKRTTLNVEVYPWATVFVDGAPMGVTPMAPIAVTPGNHSVLLYNSDLKAEHKVNVRAEPNQQTDLKYAFP